MERITTEDEGYIRIERGLGVTTLAWTTDLSLARVVNRLRVRDRVDEQKQMRLAFARNDLDDSGSLLSRAFDVAQGFELINDVAVNVRYALIPCSEYDFMWRQPSAARAQRNGGMAEVALVYEASDARLDETAVRTLGSQAVRRGLGAFAAQSQLLSER